MQETKPCPNGTACFCSKFCPGRFSPLFPVNPVRSFCCNYDRGKAIRILDTPLMVMRKLELYVTQWGKIVFETYLLLLFTSAWTFLTLSEVKNSHFLDHLPISSCPHSYKMFSKDVVLKFKFFEPLYPPCLFY